MHLYSIGYYLYSNHLEVLEQVCRLYGNKQYFIEGIWASLGSVGRCVCVSWKQRVNTIWHSSLLSFLYLPGPVNTGIRNNVGTKVCFPVSEIPRVNTCQNLVFFLNQHLKQKHRLTKNELPPGTAASGTARPAAQLCGGGSEAPVLSGLGQAAENLHGACLWTHIWRSFILHREGQTTMNWDCLMLSHPTFTEKRGRWEKMTRQACGSCLLLVRQKSHLALWISRWPMSLSFSFFPSAEGMWVSLSFSFLF